eukprot:TRINITY_DN5540_c0_g1_i1.p1 TRINITY_DN5540_c0_g1~~TRINITY_DN5540_c0_g1_i1.p1  ORF type:complete len:869 (+),score=269.23 TRINITY_DN5540_c0_g1_i1:62-2668(+)
MNKLKLNIHLVPSNEVLDLTFLLFSNKSSKISDLCPLVIKKASQLFKRDFKILKCYDMQNENIDMSTQLEKIFSNNSQVYFQVIDSSSIVENNTNIQENEKNDVEEVKVLGKEFKEPKDVKDKQDSSTASDETSSEEEATLSNLAEIQKNTQITNEEVETVDNSKKRKKKKDSLKDTIKNSTLWQINKKTKTVTSDSPRQVSVVPVVRDSKFVSLKKEYISKMNKLINLELEEELNNVKNRLKHNDKNLMEEGLLLKNLQGAFEGIHFLTQEFIGRFMATNKKKILPFHRFFQGDIVFVSRKHPIKDDVQYIGSIDSISHKNIKIIMQKKPENFNKGHWRIDKAANKVTFERMQRAIDNFTDCNMSQEIKKLVICYGDIKKLANEEIRFSKDEINPKFDFDKDSLPYGLNESQSSVIKSVFHKRLSIIQGPPGTGKTFTAVRLIALLTHYYKKSTILATCQSNTAVDNLIEGLLKLGVSSVRIGKSEKARKTISNVTLDALIEKHKNNLEISNITRSIEELKKAEGQVDVSQISALMAKIKLIQNETIGQIINSVRVVCGTNASLGQAFLEGHSFPIHILDEATQSTEPSALISLVKGTQQLFLFGDHKQLSPTVTSSNKELEKSFFVKWVEKGIEPLMLSTQYRMHPSISEFPSQQFYDGKLVNGVLEDDRKTYDNFDWVNPNVPVMFLNVNGLEEKSIQQSKYNRAEVLILVEMFKKLKKENFNFDEIAILSPYASQIKLIKRTLKTHNLLDPNLSIQTIDGFQGREKEIIIFSTVRSNVKNKVGFLSDQRRLNVALTRARRGLIVLGNQKTLQSNEVWNKWFLWAEKLDIIRDYEKPESEKINQLVPVAVDEESENENDKDPVDN